MHGQTPPSNEHKITTMPLHMADHVCLNSPFGYFVWVQSWTPFSAEYGRVRLLQAFNNLFPGTFLLALDKLHSCVYDAEVFFAPLLILPCHPADRPNDRAIAHEPIQRPSTLHFKQLTFETSGTVFAQFSHLVVSAICTG